MSQPTTAEISTRLLIMYPQIKPPTLTAAEQTRIDMFIEDAKSQLNYTHWQDKYMRGAILLSAHFLTEASTDNVSSGVIEEVDRAGTKTKFMRPSLKSFSQYSTTKYGRQFELLKKTVFSGRQVL